MSDISDSGRETLGRGDHRGQDEQHLALLTDLRHLLNEYLPPATGEKLHPSDAFFAYRLLLRRNPDPRSELPRILQARQTFREFLTSLLESPEYYHCSGILPANRLLMGEVEGIRFWFNSSDREGGALMALGMYEPHTVALLKRLIRPGMRCIDLGAHTGFYTCLIASRIGRAGKVYAFEPLPSTRGLLEKNVRENGFARRVQVVPHAASSEVTEIEGSFVSNMFISAAVDGAARVRMQTCCVDDVVRDKIDLIKMDIEGHEPAAVQGMRGIINRCRPIILTEANEYWLRICSGMNAGKYIGLLTSIGYDIYDVQDTSRPLDALNVQLDGLATLDLIAVPNERGALTSLLNNEATLTEPV